MGDPLVSVLVPVFNGEPYLAECLDSILAQDFSDYELLISDDGSTDGSAGVIRRYGGSDPRIRGWRNPANLGIGVNWNACLKQARGRYLKYVLQDDKLVHPSALRRLVAVLETDPAVSLAVTASQLMDAQSKPIQVRNCFGETAVFNGQDVILRCLGENANFIGEPSLALFRRCQAARGFDEELVQLLDLEMWFHLLEQGRFAFIGEPLCAFRQHPAQQSEMNLRSGRSAYEDLVLMQRYYAKAWLRARVTPEEIFARLYPMRRRPVHGSLTARKILLQLLGRRGYFSCWLRYRLRRPFQNLRHSVRKRLAS